MKESNNFTSFKLFFGIASAKDIIYWTLGLIFIIAMNSITPFIEYLSGSSFEYLEKMDSYNSNKNAFFSFLFGILVVVSSCIAGYFFFLYFLELTKKYRSEYYSLILDKNYLFFAQSNPNVISNTLETDLNSIDRGIGRKAFFFLNYIFENIVVMIFIAVFGFRLFLISIPLNFLILFLFHLNRKYNDELAEMNSSFKIEENSFLDELISFYKTYLLFGNTEYEKSKYLKSIKDNYIKNQENQLIRCFLHNAPNLVLNFIQCIAIFYFSFLIRENYASLKNPVPGIQNNGYTTQHYFMIYGYYMLLTSCMQGLLIIYREFSDSYNSTNNFYNLKALHSRSAKENTIIETNSEHKTVKDLSLLNNAEEKTRLNYENKVCLNKDSNSTSFDSFNEFEIKYISLVDVHLNYSLLYRNLKEFEEKEDNQKEEYENETLIDFNVDNHFEIKDVNMDFMIGKLNYILGKSGSGKSSILSLIMKLIRPTGGKIILNSDNDFNIEKLGDKDYSSLIGYVPQESLFYDLSVKDNIKFFRENISDEKVESICDFLKIDFLEKLKNGLETKIGPNGSELSGGQRQILSIARALVSDPKILLLDEFTSSLDNITSFKIQTILEQLKNKMIILIVTHKIEKRMITDHYNNNSYMIEKGVVWKTCPDTVEKLFDNFYQDEDKTDVSFVSKSENSLLNEISEKSYIDRSQIEKEAEQEDEGEEDRLNIENDNFFKDFISKNKGDLTILLIVSIFISVAYVFSLLIFAQVLSIFPNEEKLNKNFNYVIILSIVFFVYSIFYLLANSFQMYYLEKMSNKIVYKLRKKIFIWFLNLNFFNLNKQLKSELKDTFAEDIDCLGPIIGNYIQVFLQISLNVIFSFSLILYFEWKLCFALLIILSLNFVAFYVFSYSGIDYEQEIKEYEIKSQTLSNSIFNIKLIKILNVKENLIQFLIAEEEKFVKSKKFVLFSFFIHSYIYSMFFFAYGILIFIGNYFIISMHSVTYENFIVCFLLIIGSFINCLDKCIFIFDLLSSKERLSKLNHLMNVKFKKISEENDLYSTLKNNNDLNNFNKNTYLYIDNNKNGDEYKNSTMSYNLSLVSTKGLEPTDIKGKIEFRNVSFAYSNKNKRNVLNNISFTIYPGTKVGLVGLSGSGKSTVIQLLLRFYEVEQGEILLDDINIKSYDRKTLRNFISAVFQESDLFERSIYENIQYGNLKATRDQIEFGAKLACVPESFLDEASARKNIKQISGGEKQRISIARCLLKDRNIVIFDEATSALDYNTDLQVNANVTEYFRLHEHPKTFIVVAHRLTNVVDCNNILVFDDSRIIESGTHSQLLQSNKGLYKKLWEKEFNKKKIVNPRNISEMKLVEVNLK